MRPISSSTLSFIEPVYEKFYSVGLSGAAIFRRPADAVELTKENEKLRGENTELKLKLTGLQGAAQENSALRKLLDFFEDDNINLTNTVTRVIGRDPENSSILLLNVGERDGVEIGNAIIVEDGILIGKIIEVYTRSSKALLLTDAQSLVAVTVSGGAPGNKLAKGERGLSLVLDQIPQQEQIKKGELVITSGLEPKIPRGLLVGEVEEIISEKNDLFQRAVLKPLFNFDTIHLAAVILTTEEL